MNAGERGGRRLPRVNVDSFRNLRHADRDLFSADLVVDSHRSLLWIETSGLGGPAVWIRRSPIRRQPAAVHIVIPCPLILLSLAPLRIGCGILRGHSLESRGHNFSDPSLVWRGTRWNSSSSVRRGHRFRK
ncbi:MAG: hypothetical protein CBC48_08705 [bacterium TMED88]|nr:hypothetical protein [Deltaproteobacteria bacterium]OUV32215.1 MAG: hypothetical protein CBC48_08705 [bacterium TMED88]